MMRSLVRSQHHPSSDLAQGRVASQASFLSKLQHQAQAVLQRAQAAEQELYRMAALLRSMGVDPDNMPKDVDL